LTGIGLIGYGYWGPNLARNFSDVANAQLTACCDLRQDRLDLLGQKYPEVQLSASTGDVIGNPKVDAVVIATPVSTHFKLAREALIAGKHVLIEKPMATSIGEADELNKLAREKGLTLMVDHTFVYTGAVRKIKEIIDQGEMGEIYYFDSVRVNLGLFQHDSNVVWDLAPHDLSIMDYLIGRAPSAISAFGASHLGQGIENIAYLNLKFDDNLIGHIHINWLAPVKLRKTLISGTRKMIVYDDMETSEKVKVYDSGVSITKAPENIYHTMVQYRTGDMYAPKLDQREALSVECEHFIEAIESGKEPATGGHAGRRIVAMLEAAQESLAAQGAWIPVH
jgi:predicted dehydrogenase